MRFSLRTVALVGAAMPLASCAGSQSALDPHAPQAQQIWHIFLIFLALAAFVWLAVVICLGAGLVRSRRVGHDPLQIDQPFERRAGMVILAAGIGTAVAVLSLSLVSYGGQRVLFALQPPAETITLTGHQWWWAVRYEADSPDRSFVTANEIRVPVGRPVTIQLESVDVIHSFWVPSLTGKMDLIPGQQNSIQFTANNPGIYRGQCAEFCGLQHAHMALAVVALPEDQYRTWRDHENAGARDPDEPLAGRGEQLFRARGCAFCHTIRGTAAGGQLGPDLTHIGSRVTIAAGTLPRTPGTLAAWIADPQHIKPGNLMPNMPLHADEMIAILAYLEHLK